MFQRAGCLLRSCLLIAITFLVVTVAFSGGYITAMPSATSPVSAGNANSSDTFSPATFHVFWEAWDILQKNYYGDLPAPADLAAAATRGMVSSLGDSHTAFVDAKHAAIFQEDLQGNFEGIGATVRLNDQGQLVIVAPLENSPAARAGLQPGDIVISADGVSLKGMSVLEAVSLIRGPRGTTVRLMIERLGEIEPLAIDIVRDRINIAVVQFEMKADDIAYLKLTDFSANAPDQFEKALRELLDQNPKGLILDLRNNPGGFLQVAVDISGQFLPNKVILLERNKAGDKRVHRASGGGLAADIPLVLLVDKGSASASEILAGAIQDYKRGTLIGETTFGKGSVQVSHTLSDKSSLRVTIAHWFTPLDRGINGAGIEPDIKAERTVDDIRAGKDPQLDRAIEFLKTGE